MIQNQKERLQRGDLMQVEHCCYECYHREGFKCLRKNIDFKKSFVVILETELKTFGTKCTSFQTHV